MFDAVGERNQGKKNTNIGKGSDVGKMQRFRRQHRSTGAFESAKDATSNKTHQHKIPPLPCTCPKGNDNGRTL